MLSPMPTMAEISTGERKGYYPRSLSILSVAWLVYAIDVFMRYNIPTVMPILRQEYHWNAATVGWVDSAYLWAYAITQIPWGYASERWLGAKWTVTIGTGLIAVASVAFAFHIESLTLGIAARAVIGAGAAAIWVPLNPALARWFAPQRRGLQIGILGSAGSAGTLAGGALMPILVSTTVTVFGLTAIQTGFLWSAIPGIIMVLVVPFVVKDKPEEIGLRSLDNHIIHPVDVITEKEPSFWYVMGHSGYPYLLAFVYAGYLGALYFIWTWFSSYLNEAYHINVKSAGLIWALAASFPGFVSQPFAGWLSDRIGRVRAVSAALFATSLCGAGFVVFDLLGPQIIPWWVVMILAVVFSFFVNMWVLAWPFTTSMFPTTVGGPVGGFMNTSAQLVGAAAPVVSGYLIDASHSYLWVFVIGTALPAVASVAALFLKDRRVI
jgi:MFS transporter, ACS family, D-galactonate transporter